MASAPEFPPLAPKRALGLERLANSQEWILAGVAIATWFFMRQIQPSHDVFWQFWVARQMLGGARLYADIWEVNPPLWFWSAMPVQWLATQCGVAWQEVLLPLLVLTSAVSAILVLRLVDLGKPLYNLILLVIIFWLSAVVPLADLGQREHYVLMFGLPYAALIARRVTGKSVAVPLALVIGVLASYGFALKHYFLLVPIALELWLWISLRRSWKPWRPEIIVLAGLAAAYAVCVFWLTPEFFTIALPMIEIAYHGYDATLFEVLFHPWVIFWALAILFLLTFHRNRKCSTKNDASAFFVSLIIMAACFFIAYFWQHKGPYYHGIPATGALTIAIFLCLIGFELIRVIPSALGIALMYLPLSTSIAIQDNSKQFVRLTDKLFSRVHAGESVFVAGTNPLFWPAIEKHKLVWPFRSSSLWTLPAIAQSERMGVKSPELQKMAAELNSAIREDLRCNPPTILLFPHSIPAGDGRHEFLTKDFLFRDPGLRQFIESNYSESEEPNSVHVYLRKRTVPRAANLNCRIVR